MESVEKSLVLKVGRFKEVDAWVRLFSARKGIFTAFAFGGSVSRRRFLGCLDPLNIVSFKVRTDVAKGYAYLLEGSLIAAHPRVRADGERLGMAVNCLKFLEAAHLGPTGGEGAFGLMEKTLAALEEADAPSRLVPLFFRARMAFDQGFRPDLENCARCGADLAAADSAQFLVEQGKLHCQACRQWGKGASVALGAEAVETLRRIRSSEPAQWALVRTSGQARMECGRALDMFVEYHLGLTWEHGSFRRI